MGEQLQKIGAVVTATVVVILVLNSLGEAFPEVSGLVRTLAVVMVLAAALLLAGGDVSF